MFYLKEELLTVPKEKQKTSSDRRNKVLGCVLAKTEANFVLISHRNFLQSQKQQLNVRVNLLIPKALPARVTPEVYGT